MAVSALPANNNQIPAADSIPHLSFLTYKSYDRAT